MVAGCHRVSCHSEEPQRQRIRSGRGGSFTALGMTWALLLPLTACGGAAPSNVAPSPVSSAGIASKPAEANPSGVVRITIGTPSAAAPSAIVPVTKYGGFYEKYGLDSEVQILSGAANLLASMISGQVPFTYQGSPEVIRASLSGAD